MFKSSQCRWWFQLAKLDPSAFCLLRRKPGVLFSFWIFDMKKSFSLKYYSLRNIRTQNSTFLKNRNTVRICGVPKSPPSPILEKDHFFMRGNNKREFIFKVRSGNMKKQIVFYTWNCPEFLDSLASRNQTQKHFSKVYFEK